MTTAQKIADQTREAYSFDTYGAAEWLACAQLLMDRNFTAEEAKWVLESKLTRWAADAHGATAKGLAAFLDDPRNKALETIRANTVG